MNTPNQLTKLYNDGFNDGYNKAKNGDTDQNNSNMYCDGYNEGYALGFDEGRAQVRSEINHELQQLKIKLEEAERFQAFWRECYHIEHNKLILAENKLKKTDTNPI